MESTCQECQDRRRTDVATRRMRELPPDLRRAVLPPAKRCVRGEAARLTSERSQVTQRWRGVARDPCHRRKWPRSEEHTSELQSRRDLVCRLLLEKKKKSLQTQALEPLVDKTA